MSKTKKKDKPEEPKKAKASKSAKKSKPASKVKKETSKKEPSILESVLSVAPAVIAEVAAPVLAAVEPAKPKRKAPARKASAVEIVVSVEEIGLRAYFISERRQQAGAPGDEVSDWVEAERELRHEAEKAAKRGRKK